MNAAGLFNELIGAPLRIMPPKMAMSPDNRPISVDFSKKIPLFPNGRDAGRLLQRRLPTCIQHPQTMQMIFAASSSLLAADSVGRSSIPDALHLARSSLDPFQVMTVETSCLKRRLQSTT